MDEESWLSGGSPRVFYLFSSSSATELTYTALGGWLPARAQQLAAFPGAQGGGAASAGGRGGHIYLVDNLNDSGPGSLRACMEDNGGYGARTCIFRVGGIIQLATGIHVLVPNLTVADVTCSSPSSGWTIESQLAYAGSTVCMLDQITSAAGSYQASIASSLSENYVMEIVTFKGKP